MAVSFVYRIFIYITNVENRLVGKQKKATCQLFFFRIQQLYRTCTFAPGKSLVVSFKQGGQTCSRFIAPGNSLFLHFSQTVLNSFKVFNLQLGLNNFHVPYGVHRAAHMCYFRIIKTSDYM